MSFVYLLLLVIMFLLITINFRFTKGNPLIGFALSHTRRGILRA